METKILRTWQQLLLKYTRKTEKATLTIQYLDIQLIQSTFCLGGDSLSSTNVDYVATPVVCDEDLLEILQQLGTVNWLPNVDKLYPIRIPYTQNSRSSLDSLLETVIISMWGPDAVQTADVTEYLGQLLSEALSSNGCDDSQLARRWRQHNNVISIAAGDNLLPWYETCCGQEQQQVHAICVFVLSHIICRPIIVLSANNDSRLRGIYLPILHGSNLCTRQPIIIVESVSDDGYFLPLITAKRVDQQTATPPGLVVPLCNHNLEPLPVRCLLDCERADSLLEIHLEVTEVLTGDKDVILATKLDRSSRSELVQQLLANGTEESCRSSTSPGLCSSPRCRYYGLREYDGKCMACSGAPNNSKLPGFQNKEFFCSTSLSATGHKNAVLCNGVTSSELKETPCIAPGCKQCGSMKYRGFCVTCYISQDLEKLDDKKQGLDVRASLRASNDVQSHVVAEIAPRHVTFSTEVMSAVSTLESGQDFPCEKTRSRCIYETCQSAAVPGSYFCHSCEQEQQRILSYIQEQQYSHNRPQQRGVHKRTEVPRRSATVTGTEFQRQAGIERTAHPCLNVRCDRFGDPYFSGYCSVCFRRR